MFKSSKRVLFVFFSTNLIITSFSTQFYITPAIILNVSVGFLSHFYLVLFTQPVPFYLPCSLLLTLFPFCFTCSFFTQLVPFLLSLCLFCPSPSKLVSFLSTLCLFYPKPLSKKTQPLFLFALLVRVHFYIYTDLHTKSNNIFRHCCL